MERIAGPRAGVMHNERIAVFGLLIVMLAFATLHRNEVWHSLLSLWTDCTAKSPVKSRTHNNLGNCYLLLGRDFDAIAEYQKAVKLDEGNMEAQYNLASELDHVGLSTQAVKPYDVFCKMASSEYAEQKAASCRRVQEIVRSAGARSMDK